MTRVFPPRSVRSRPFLEALEARTVPSASRLLPSDAPPLHNLGADQKEAVRIELPRTENQSDASDQEWHLTEKLDNLFRKAEKALDRAEDSVRETSTRIRNQVDDQNDDDSSDTLTHALQTKPKTTDAQERGDVPVTTQVVSTVETAVVPVTGQVVPAVQLAVPVSESVALTVSGTVGPAVPTAQADATVEPVQVAVTTGATEQETVAAKNEAAVRSEGPSLSTALAAVTATPAVGTNNQAVAGNLASTLLRTLNGARSNEQAALAVALAGNATTPQAAGTTPGVERTLPGGAPTETPVAEAPRTGPATAGVQEETPPPPDESLPLMTDFHPDAAGFSMPSEEVVAQATVWMHPGLRYGLLALGAAGVVFWAVSRRRKKRGPGEPNDAVWTDGSIERWAL
jgi:hypothetical protein